jgi:hypothetical protein
MKVAEGRFSLFATPWDNDRLSQRTRGAYARFLVFSAGTGLIGKHSNGLRAFQTEEPKGLRCAPTSAIPP